MNADVFKFVIFCNFLQNSRSIEGHIFHISHTYIFVGLLYISLIFLKLLKLR